MKKVHIALLVVAFITVLASGYSLAAINQVYSINFQWYSTYNKNFSDERRDLSRDKWQLEGDLPKLNIGLTANGYIESDILEKVDSKQIADSTGNYLMLWAALGEESSPEYSVKVSSIAQRGEVVEVVISLNSPSKIWEKDKDFTSSYYPFDLVRINKASFATKGKMLFIFKDQEGRQLYSEYIYVS
jgi:hypothetical protein